MKKKTVKGPRKIKVTVFDLVPREVQLPIKCPYCKTDFRERHNLKQWCWVDTAYYATIDAQIEDGKKVLFVNSEGDMARGGEGCNPCEYMCVMCGAIVA